MTRKTATDRLLLRLIQFAADRVPKHLFYRGHEIQFNARTLPGGRYQHTVTGKYDDGKAWHPQGRSRRYVLTLETKSPL